MMDCKGGGSLLLKANSMTKLLQPIAPSFCACGSLTEVRKYISYNKHIQWRLWYGRRFRNHGSF